MLCAVWIEAGASRGLNTARREGQPDPKKGDSASEGHRSDDSRDIEGDVVVGEAHADDDIEMRE